MFLRLQPASQWSHCWMLCMHASMTRMTKDFDDFDAILAACRAAVDEAIGRSSEEEEDWM